MRHEWVSWVSITAASIPVGDGARDLSPLVAGNILQNLFGADDGADGGATGGGSTSRQDSVNVMQAMDDSDLDWPPLCGGGGFPHVPCFVVSTFPYSVPMQATMVFAMGEIGFDLFAIQMNVYRLTVIIARRLQLREMTAMAAGVIVDESSVRDAQ